MTPSKNRLSSGLVRGLQFADSLLHFPLVRVLHGACMHDPSPVPPRVHLQRDIRGGLFLFNGGDTSLEFVN
jgi:hypothetical protein